ncbi:MAG: sulfotransferase [Proteobacteria bacterium]|nr:sulfotransferase [Pseudomonadota bacterium]MBU1736843.1 sulfotransferase [Pseudomonadota bacterium]
MITLKRREQPISTWQKFSREVRSKGCNLLAKLGDYPEPVLVTGCQRSGTTLLARILRQSEGFVDFQTGKDDELDAALILCGHKRFADAGRYCFQTTYVNECYHEYFAHKDHVKMIWILRNPYSVVWSMVNNWENFALNELYHACGEKHHPKPCKSLFKNILLPWEDKLTRACLAYKGKTAQVFDIAERFSPENLLVIEYDDLIRQSGALLRTVYEFINEPYLESLSGAIHTGSLSKFKSFSPEARAVIEEHCAEIYAEARKLMRSSCNQPTEQ